MLKTLGKMPLRPTQAQATLHALVFRCPTHSLRSKGDTMPNDEPLQMSTLIVVAIIVFGLVFAGSWIYSDANASGNPSALIPWFAAAAGTLVVLALLAYGLRRGGRNDQ